MNDSRENALQVAQELGTAPEPLPEDLRKRFIDVRAVLFQRGIFDPVLARFDSATVPKASAQEVGQELAKVAESL